jgi:LysM repeat protein
MLTRPVCGAKIITIFILPLLLLANTVAGQSGQRITVQEYIQTYQHIAIKKMREYKIPASITLAQGILESGTGNSELARKANNHFGIKCHGTWRGKKFYKDDDHKHECFRKYNNAEESFHDHSLFLTQRGRYKDLFSLEITDYKGWAHGLKKAGYATNPKYPQLLIHIIEENNLHYFDRGVEPIASKRTNTTIEIPQTPYPSERTFKMLELGPNERKIYENNGLKFIYARNGDTFEKIAEDFDLYSWQVYKYNDLDKNDKITMGQILYLEKKKNKGNKAYHITREGESMYYIAQMYGIKLSKLLKINNMEPGMYPFIGQKIKLK